MPAKPAERIAYAGLARSENSASQEDGPGLEPLPPTARDKHDGPSPTRDGGMSLPARAWIIVGAAGLLWIAAALGIALLF
ncbi:hypothetical protein [Sphingosinicella sp. CPCC 101087]|uniref:hypothetical protein n=1 Tax=Sphingosinicella sp. CPCC 101087 TaxID=2497754 RepID=UPI00101BFAB0|nr:hypothetical protein [Sphingosinicella sp. CPCC 101087]